MKPAVNQIETNVWNQEWKSQTYMEKEAVQPEAWAPFAEGADHIFTNPVLAEIANKHGKTTAQVMIRWFLQRNYVVIPVSRMAGLRDCVWRLYDESLYERTRR